MRAPHDPGSSQPQNASRPKYRDRGASGDTGTGLPWPHAHPRPAGRRPASCKACCSSDHQTHPPLPSASTAPRRAAPRNRETPTTVSGAALMPPACFRSRWARARAFFFFVWRWLAGPRAGVQCPGVPSSDCRRRTLSGKGDPTYATLRPVRGQQRGAPVALWPGSRAAARPSTNHEAPAAPCAPARSPPASGRLVSLRACEGWPSRSSLCFLQLCSNPGPLFSQGGPCPALQHIH